MKKKVSFVFGGSRGIGSVITRELEKRGDKVYVISRKDSKFSNNININLLDKKDISLGQKRYTKKTFHRCPHRHKNHQDYIIR